MCVCAPAKTLSIHTSVPAHGEGAAATHRHGNTCLLSSVAGHAQNGPTARRLATSHCAHTQTHTHTLKPAGFLQRVVTVTQTQKRWGCDSAARACTHTHTGSLTPRQKPLSPAFVNSFVSQELLLEWNNSQDFCKLRPSRLRTPP